ncbi:MAG: type II secretion system protein GspM [Steroidobacteraceae bacterium]
MLTALTARYRALQERERRFLQIGAAVIAIFILAALVSLDRSVAHASSRLAHREQDLAWMRHVAPQLAAAGPASPQRPSSSRSLIVIVDASAREVGLGPALTQSEPSGRNGLRVRLEKAPFDIMVGWLARLSQQSGIHVESATIDSTGAPGIVNAGLVLEAAR